MDNCSWPPNYRLRRSARAKHVNFYISPTHGLEIVIPQRFNLKNLPEALNGRRPWIEKHLVGITEKIVEEITLPAQLQLNAIQQTWKVEYQYAVCKLKLIRRPDHTLVMLGPIEEKARCFELLMRWLKQQATLFLVPWLKEISEKINLPYQFIGIRIQSTRWGSCSATQRIHLNALLLFLPRAFVEYVMIHELCHTKHFNHSDRFWRLVAMHDPNFQAHRAGLRTAGEYVPQIFQNNEVFPEPT